MQHENNLIEGFIKGDSKSFELNELSAGYLVSFGYLIFEWFSKGRYTKGFYLHSLLNGRFDDKYRIMAVCILLIMLNIWNVYKRS